MNFLAQQNAHLDSLINQGVGMAQMGFLGGIQQESFLRTQFQDPFTGQGGFAGSQVNFKNAFDITSAVGSFIAAQSIPNNGQPIPGFTPMDLMRANSGAFNTGMNYVGARNGHMNIMDFNVGQIAQGIGGFHTGQTPNGQMIHGLDNSFTNFAFNPSTSSVIGSNTPINNPFFIPINSIF